MLMLNNFGADWTWNEHKAYATISWSSLLANILHALAKWNREKNAIFTWSCYATVQQYALCSRSSKEQSSGKQFPRSPQSIEQKEKYACESNFKVFWTTDHCNWQSTNGNNERVQHCETSCKMKRKKAAFALNLKPTSICISNRSILHTFLGLLEFPPFSCVCVLLSDYCHCCVGFQIAWTSQKKRENEKKNWQNNIKNQSEWICSWKEIT